MNHILLMNERALLVAHLSLCCVGVVVAERGEELSSKDLLDNFCLINGKYKKDET